jgi:hypothetical protein
VDDDDDDLSDVDNESLRSDDADVLLLSEAEEEEQAAAGASTRGRRLWDASTIHPSTKKNWQERAWANGVLWVGSGHGATADVGIQRPLIPCSLLPSHSAFDEPQRGLRVCVSVRQAMLKARHGLPC